MDLERQRGITIKARAVCMRHTHNGEEYELNLIDTPGHVDFHYEVSRSLACCEGAVLLVDAFQGVEAQTVANAYAAMEHDLTIVPVLNKVDLKHARPDEVNEEMHQSLGIEPDEVLQCSGKTGEGVEELLAAIVERVPPPKGDPDGAAAGDGVRQALRRVPRRDHLRAADERHGGARARRFGCSRGGTTHEVLELGQFVPQRRAVRAVAGRAGGLSDLQHQDRCTTYTSATR